MEANSDVILTVAKDMMLTLLTKATYNYKPNAENGTLIQDLAKDTALLATELQHALREPTGRA